MVKILHMADSIRLFDVDEPLYVWVLCSLVVGSLVSGMIYLIFIEFWATPINEQREEKKAIETGDYKRVAELRQRRIHRNRDGDRDELVLPR